MSISIIGHDRQIKYINTTRTHGRLPHAYCFYGPEHVGKMTIAQALAQSFFCPNAKKNDIRSRCGECLSCRAVAEFRHPHVIMLDTTHTIVSKKETRKEIPIEDIRELKRLWSFASQGDTMRVVVINEAEKMSEESANAFLKLLEEPGAHTLIILITPSRDLLLPTILSRTQALGFLTVSDVQMNMLADTLNIASRDRADLLVLSMGRPGVLVELAANKESADEERALLKAITAGIANRDLVSLMHISEQASKDPVLRAKTIAHLFSLLRSRMVKGGNGATLLAAAIHGIDRIAHLIDSTNANPRLGMDALFLEAVKA